MSDNIDILIAIDTAALPELSTDKNNPTAGLNNHVYMIVTQDDALSGNGNAELNISANIGDNVRWRVSSLDSNFENTVMLYDFVASDGVNLLSTPQLLGGVKDNTIYKKSEITPKQGDMPLSGQMVDTPYNFFQSSIEAKGNVTYRWLFQVNDTNSGNLIGYGTWDPFISIT